jgi:cell division protein FtsX
LGNRSSRVLLKAGHSLRVETGSGRARIFNAIFAFMAKDTAKAIAIIVAALLVLAGLLVFANHVRPH